MALEDITKSSNPVIDSCIFVNNEAIKYGGGAVYLAHVGATISNSLISSNIANYGGAIFQRHSSLSLVQSLIVNNSTVGQQSIIGGTEGAALDVAHCTFADNVSQDSSINAVFYDSSCSEVEFINCIIWKNIGVINKGVVSYSYSIVQDTVSQAGNLMKDPLFDNDNYSLQASSPAIAVASDGSNLGTTNIWLFSKFSLRQFGSGMNRVFSYDFGRNKCEETK